MGFGFDNETVKDVIHDIFLDIMTRQVDLGRIVNIKAYLFPDRSQPPGRPAPFAGGQMRPSDREPGLRVSLTSLDAMIESEHVLRIRQTIESLLNQLSPKQREALLLRFVYEMEYDDIAVILDATPHAVRKFVSKGLGKLRKGRECGKTMKNSHLTRRTLFFAVRGGTKRRIRRHREKTRRRSRSMQFEDYDWNQ